VFQTTAKRAWHCYARIRSPAYQKKRSRSHRKEFVRGGADPKIRMFDMGNREKPLDDWELSLGLIVDHTRQVSHFALEAIRVSLNRRLQQDLGKDGFHVRIRIHPYQIYRENRMLAFAGADRLQSGMRNSFGRCIGPCARIKAGQTIAEAFCDFKSKDTVIDALRIIKYKLPTTTRIVALRINKKGLEHKIGIPLALERPIPQ
jgi:large subunit ribosomal protein L10e